MKSEKFYVDWIKCSDRLPNNDDIIANNSDIFWVYLENLYGDYDVTAISFNIGLNCWEILPNETVYYWAYFNTPESPISS